MSWRLLKERLGFAIVLLLLCLLLLDHWLWYWLWVIVDTLLFLFGQGGVSLHGDVDMVDDRRGKRRNRVNGLDGGSWGGRRRVGRWWWW